MVGPSLGLQRSSQSAVGRTVWKSSLEPKGQKLVLALKLFVLKCLQAKGRRKGVWKHRGSQARGGGNGLAQSHTTNKWQTQDNSV